MILIVYISSFAISRALAARHHHRWMRHPGYAGAALAYLVTPVFLDSSWAFLPAILITIILVIRTYLEDTTLQVELEDYHDYASRVHYRLLPGIW